MGSEASPYFPPPSTWLPALARLSHDGALWPALAATVVTVTVALGVATVLGALLGCLVGASPRADRALGPIFEVSRATPPAVMVPVATLLLGYGGTMKVTVVTLAAIWAVLLNTRAGVKQMDPVLLDTARMLRLRRLDRIGKVILPALIPSIFLGVRVAAPIALVITLLVEILTQVPGLGGLIATAQRTFRSPEVYGLVVVAGLISLSLNALVAALETYVFRNRPMR
jgi:ABC-type nitrate/sulfonate/bicarbonate transport system permease component